MLKASPSIPTVASLQRQRRRLAHTQAGVHRVLTAMRAGATLHLSFGRSQPCWHLSDGRYVDETVAQIIITRPEVTSVGDALFKNMPAQTYRYCE